MLIKLHFFLIRRYKLESALLARTQLAQSHFVEEAKCDSMKSSECALSADELQSEDYDDGGGGSLPSSVVGTKLPHSLDCWRRSSSGILVKDPNVHSSHDFCSALD